MKQRGFSLFTVIMILAALTVAAMVVIRLVAEDDKLRGMERRGRQARNGAESALQEIMNDNRLGAELPTPDVSSQTVTYSRSAESHVYDYRATIGLARVVPMRESSYSTVRAVVYDVSVSADTEVGHRANISAEFYKIASSQNGVVRPRRHAR